MEFFAHSAAGRGKADWQTLREHLRNVGELAARNASFFGGHELGLIAGLLHDLGKYCEKFQARLDGAGERVDHSTHGAIVAVRRYRQLGTLLAYAIAGHHAGLANGTGESARTSLDARLRAPDLPRLLDAWQDEIELPDPAALDLPAGFRPRQARTSFQLAFLVRMLFSCLVDADFIDTDGFYRRIENRPPRRQATAPSLEALRARLDEHLAGFRPDTEVNRRRSEILGHVRGMAGEAPGLFSLTVPTGGGKTLASLAFALDHAIAHGLRRVIFVIPFTSIVEQNAAVFRNALGDLGEDAVLEHHSAFVDDPSSAKESREKLRLAMENWDAPIVVTTAVQFFESLFADRPSRCRKLHNIAGSVVILDEAQTMPLKLLRPCVAAIDELALNYRTSVVLCTATQPALNEEDGFVGGLSGVRELAPDPAHLYAALRRVRVRHLGTLDDAALTDALRQREQVLCIVNNRLHARALFRAIADMPGARHLSTLMCARHRSEVLAEVRAALAANAPCRLVSTSLIEAGVDISLPTVMRAEAGLDAIAQAAGRCNREGRRPIEDSEVLVFATAGEDWAPPPELRQFAEVFREVFRQHPDDPLALDAIRAYFELLYWRKGPLELDAHDLLGLLRASRIDSLPLETLASRFRMIETAMRPVIVPYDDGAKAALRDLEYAEGAVGLARRLQPYIVQLPKQGYEALHAKGAIRTIRPDRFGDQFVALVNDSIYDERFGLWWEDPTFSHVQALVI